MNSYQKDQYQLMLMLNIRIIVDISDSINLLRLECFSWFVLAEIFTYCEACEPVRRLVQADFPLF